MGVRRARGRRKSRRRFPTGDDAALHSRTASLPGAIVPREAGVRSTRGREQWPITDMGILTKHPDGPHAMLLSRHVVGRSRLADLRMTDPTVSGEHAVLLAL